MTRNQKISKLANAIREFRGATKTIGGPWVRPPMPSKEKNVRRWLGELGLDVEKSMTKINGFKLIAEFNDWLKTIST